MRISNYILLIIALFLFSCEKTKVEDQEQYTTEFVEAKKDIDIYKKILLPSGLEGYNYGYAAIETLKNGELIIICNRFKEIYDKTVGGHFIIMKSYDNGDSWTEPEMLQENVGGIRVTDPSIVKISDNHLMFFFTIINSSSDIEIAVKESYDAGNTWSQYRKLDITKGYNILNCGKVTFANNRLYIPVAYVKGDIYALYDKQVVFYYYSDDFGRTWRTEGYVYAATPLMEPGLTIFDDKSMLYNIRTKKSNIYFARKSEKKAQWTLYNTNIPSPASPQKIHKYANTEDLVMIWNYNSIERRNPLSIAISKDKGHNWRYLTDLENSDNYDFAYATTCNDDTYFYATYYKRSLFDKGKSSLIFVRMLNSDLME